MLHIGTITVATTIHNSWPCVRGGGEEINRRATGCSKKCKNAFTFIFPVIWKLQKWFLYCGKEQDPPTYVGYKTASERWTVPDMWAEHLVNHIIA